MKRIILIAGFVVLGLAFGGAGTASACYRSCGAQLPYYQQYQNYGYYQPYGYNNSYYNDYYGGMGYGYNTYGSYNNYGYGNMYNSYGYGNPYNYGYGYNSYGSYGGLGIVGSIGLMFGGGSYYGW